MEQKGTFRGAMDRTKDSQRPQLYLVPILPKGQASGRSLPFELGRVELVRWWLTSCCMNRTNTPKNECLTLDRSSCCDRCRLVVDNAKYLSKSMIRLEQDISNRLVVLGKNSKCLYMNGKSIEKSQSTGKGGISITDGDILWFQSDDTSPPWMEFRICSSSSTCMVTPEGKNIRKSHDGDDDSDNDTSSRRNDNRSRKEVSQLDKKLSSCAMRRETFVMKRKRADESSLSLSNINTKRKLFSTPDKQRGTPNTHTNISRKEDTSKVASGMLFHTQKDSSSTNEQHTQANSNQEKECFSSVEDSSSMLSLPQFPSDNHYTSDGESEQMVLGGSTRDGQNSAKQASTTGCDLDSRSLSAGDDDDDDDDDDTVEWKPVSDLTRSEWQELHQPTTTTRTAASSVRQALAGLILEQNAAGKIDWLPDLLNGTVIRQNDVVPTEERKSSLS